MLLKKKVITLAFITNVAIASEEIMADIKNLADKTNVKKLVWCKKY
jgi:hypothetical protein